LLDTQKAQDFEENLVAEIEKIASQARAPALWLASFVIICIRPSPLHSAPVGRKKGVLAREAWSSLGKCTAVGPRYSDSG
jgi:hypothetical protein